MCNVKAKWRPGTVTCSALMGTSTIPTCSIERQRRGNKRSLTVVAHATVSFRDAAPFFGVQRSSALLGVDQAGLGLGSRLHVRFHGAAGATSRPQRTAALRPCLLNVATGLYRPVEATVDAATHRHRSSHSCIAQHFRGRRSAVGTELTSAPLSSTAAFAGFRLPSSVNEGRFG